MLLARSSLHTWQLHSGRDILNSSLIQTRTAVLSYSSAFLPINVDEFGSGNNKSE